MDRELLEQRLAAAKRNVALSFEVVADQRQVVSALEAWGTDARVARRMLQAFEEMQAGFVEDLESATVQLAADDQRAAVSDAELKVAVSRLKDFPTSRS